MADKLSSTRRKDKINDKQNFWTVFSLLKVKNQNLAISKVEDQSYMY